MARTIVIPVADCVDVDAMLAELRDYSYAYRDAYVVHAYVPVPAAIDQDGRRADAPEPADLPTFTLEQARRVLEIRDRHAAPVDLDRYRIERPSRFRDHAEEISYVRSLDFLFLASVPIPGRDGWRRTGDGREWYSAEWLGAVS